MPYVQRDDSGKITGVYALPQKGYAEEHLDDSDLGVIALMKPSAAISPISDRQFFQQLAMQGIVNQDEALAAVRTGVVPGQLQQLIDGLPPDQRFAATMILSGATAFERNHPLTAAFGDRHGWSPEQVDDFFRAAAAL